MTTKVDPGLINYNFSNNRQIVVSGRKVSGVPDYIESYTSGTTGIRLKASTDVPLILKVSDGYNSETFQPVDYTVGYTQDFDPVELNNVGSLPDGDYYIYVDVDRTTKTVSYGVTALLWQPGEQAPTIGLSSGLQWFDIHNYFGEVYNGSIWERKARYQIGGFTVTAGVVSGLWSVAIRGMAVVRQAGVTLNQTHILPHYLGVSGDWYDEDGVYNNVSGAGGAGGVVDGTGGWRIGDGMYANPLDWHYTRIRKTSQTSITLTTGDYSIYHDTVLASNFTTGDAVITVRRKF